MQTPDVFIRHPKTDAFVCCCECIKNKIVSASIDENRVFSLNLPLENFRNSVKSKKNDEMLTFVFIGEISRSKGVLDILETIKNLNEKFRFFFIGSGPLLDELKSASRGDGRIVVKGFLGKKEILDVLVKSDVLVHP